MVLPPHLLNLQEKLTSMNLPKMPIQSSPPKTQTQMQSESQFTNQSKNTFNIKNEKHSFINTKFNKKWKTLRKAAGVIWEDSTLDEWPDNDYRIFCGDLGNEVSDQILANAFSKYQSLKKAKVIRDKNTGTKEFRELIKEIFVKFIDLGHQLGFSDNDIIESCLMKIRKNKKIGIAVCFY